MGLFDALARRKPDPSVAEQMTAAYEAADRGD